MMSGISPRNARLGGFTSIAPEARTLTTSSCAIRRIRSEEVAAFLDEVPPVRRRTIPVSHLREKGEAVLAHREHPKVPDGPGTDLADEHPRPAA